jgi:hypothetical protein
MQRLLKGILTALLITVALFGQSQIVLEQVYDVPVELDGFAFEQSWDGGLNSCQYNKADMDGDGKEELILYDRSANGYQIFREEENQYLPSNDLCVLLPEIQAGWVLFVDYNMDGKKDIFSNGERGIVVFENISTEGQLAQWEKVANPLLTTGFSGKINLIANSSDVPAITDIDGDGDIDILVYNFAIGGYIRFNKNLSQELFGHSDALEYEIYTRTWGEFEECECNIFAFNGQSCGDLSNGRVAHIGGKALLAIDTDGDGDKDLLSGQEQCEELYFFENRGDIDSAYMVDFSSLFPDDNQPANFQIFPTAYYEDLDFDGVKDLIVSPGVEENVGFKVDFAHSNWFYKNSGSNNNPEFVYQQNDIIQGQMMDFGENAMPVFSDLNADGKIDLLVAANGHLTGGTFIGSVIELENSGTPEHPSFKIKSKNYLDLASLNLLNPKINLVDFDGDRALDLVYTGMEINDTDLISWLFINQAEADQPSSFDLNIKVEIQFQDIIKNGDSPAFFDVDEDGNVDLLLGTVEGALEYHSNNGDNTFELISPAFPGIERDFLGERKNLVASIGDLDLNGKADLISTDYSGEGRVYFDFQQQMEGESTYVDLTQNNSITDRGEQMRFDSHSWVSSADLYNAGTESLVVGGIRGGMQLFRNTSTGNPGGSDGAIEVTIYPNPIHGTSGLHLKANQDLTVELISVLGQSIMAPFSIKKFTTSSVDVAHLRNGAYILKSQNKDGGTSSELFLILR